MILAVLDDLMFMSKIRAAAGPLGVLVRFSKSSAQTVAHARDDRPNLIIFDLDNPRTDPLATVAALKADPTTAGVPTLGFVSHVHADLIDAGRRAGIDEVLARSAFTAQLPAILARGGSAST
jgi:PleD family two-component response regulator